MVADSAYPGERYQSADSMASQYTETLRGDSTVRGSSEDTDMMDVGRELGDAKGDKRFIVAIDFGTTFTSISFLSLSCDTDENDEPETHVLIDQIKSIGNFPDEPRNGYRASRKDVPSEIWYPKQLDLESRLVKERNNVIDLDDLDVPDDDQPHHQSAVTDDDVDMDDDEFADDEDKETFWGYEVQKRLQLTDSNRNQNRRMSRFKLLLDQSGFTDQVRQDLEPNCAELRRRKIIKKNEDVIGDYLTYLFRHAKTELVEHHNFSDACPIEFVLCVPPIWTAKASRIMQDNMQRAIVASEFGRVDNQSVDNLFIVSEPEAAAAYVLARGVSILPKETFVLIDAGGGTVDTTTYTVEATYPLRLKSESVEATGDLCGSSYLNEAYREHLRGRLEEETYLEVNGQTIESIIDSLVIKFENEFKRPFDVTKTVYRPEIIQIGGLRPNPRPLKRLLNGRLKIESTDLQKIFIPLLERVVVLMRNQLESARQQGINVKKVLLIGGFADNPSLRSFLSRELAAMRNHSSNEIKLITPEAADNAVSAGAVLRALNKRDGPARISRSSYGLLCTEEFMPEEFAAHVGMKPFTDPLNGWKCIKNTIAWQINKGDEIPTMKEYSVQMFVIFDTKKATRFECKEFLYVADKRTESHYRKDHEKNTGAGASIIGTIETDLTFLKERNLIQPIEAGNDGISKWKRHYQVEYELVMIVNDRNMRWEARYPAGGEVQGVGQVSIAAAFVPGTK